MANKALVRKVCCADCAGFVEAVNWAGRPTGNGGCPPFPSMNHRATRPRYCSYYVPRRTVFDEVLDLMGAGV